MPLPRFLSCPERPLVPNRWSRSYRIITAVELLNVAHVRVTVQRVHDLCGCKIEDINAWIQRNRENVPVDVDIVTMPAHRHMLRQTRIAWTQNRQAAEGKVDAMTIVTRLMRNRKRASHAREVIRA